MTTISMGSHDHRAEPETSTPQTDALEPSGNECELSVAIADHLADLSAGRFVKESVSRHVARLATLM